MKFEAEVLEIKVKKTISNDKEIIIKLQTLDESALKLQEAISNNTITVLIEEVAKNYI